SDLPKLVKEGFRGKIFATAPTFDIAQIMLLDSAALLYEEYETLLKKALRKGEESTVTEPLYLKEHVEQVFSLPLHSAKYDEPIIIAPFLSLTFLNAGHILGSSFINIIFRENDMDKSVIFSGDIGSHNRLLLNTLENPPKAQTLFIESTYGDREHRDIKESIAEFREAILSTLETGGNVIIPTFALERTQEILWLLHSMHKEGLLHHCHVFLDSPLAIEATKIYRKYPAELNQQLGLHVSLGDDPFSFPQLKLTPRKADSIDINEIQKKAIIIAGSGMCTGGRIVHHLKHRIWNPKNTIIFVGYQVKGTMGRDIVDGENFIRIYGEEVHVRAKVHTINGFSAHADRHDMLMWLKEIKDLNLIYLIHGEIEKIEAFKEYILNNFTLAKVHRVTKGERFYIA
ncbi:MAG: MBL fold metallo-hydrolase, partial [Sulfurospirillaceae bacterium]|nr:MBL fold metallo-hydrolase [Sulfurospirillaceae bacterium]